MKFLSRYLTLVVLSVLAGCGGGSSDNETGGSTGSGTDNNSEPKTLNVVSWGGAYEFSQVEAYHKPWTASTGHLINSIDYNGDVSDIRSQVNSGNVVWDVVDVELPDAKSLCEQGLLEPIDADQLPPSPNGTSARSDFVNGTLSPCGVGSIIWSTIIAFDTNLATASPLTMADFFDLANFPGKRGVRRNPKTILEMALMADGVPPGSVYSELSSAAGIDQAFAKLDQIKGEIVWWDSGAESMQQLENGAVVMTTAYNGRVFNEVALNEKSYGMVWDAQVWDIDLWVIPKGAPNKDLALEFVHFSTAAEQLAKQASYISYAPARQSSYALVGKHFELDIDMKPYMPVAPQNFQRALQTDNDFWAANQQTLDDRFASWLAE